MLKYFGRFTIKSSSNYAPPLMARAECDEKTGHFYGVFTNPNGYVQLSPGTKITLVQITVLPELDIIYGFIAEDGAKYFAHDLNMGNFPYGTKPEDVPITYALDRAKEMWLDE